ncbi:tRNA lysidine(34) synthetase TilS [Clostridium sp. AM58-1XD]|uniref:tRNA lysidine(34) synthetase TilS n=1 Tax=Clostridium sp. AM58-1XD TaxID=2292307 RepID=UPI0026A370AA
MGAKTFFGRLNITIEAFHLHHGLRGKEADRDADFVRDICAEWDIPATIRREDVRGFAAEHGCSLEEAGRILRYGALDELKKAAEAETGRPAAVAVAHHRGDSAETILHNLFRGSGLKGLRGIAPVRDGIIRPLIEVGRDEIEEFLTDMGIGWCEDSTNSDNDYTRNKIRNQILPLVRAEINKEADTHILQAGKLISMADDFLEKTAEELWKQCGEVHDRKGCAFPVSDAEKQEEIIRYYLIRHMIRLQGGSVKDFTLLHVEAVDQLIRGQTGKRTDLPGKMQGWREYGKLWIGRKQDEKRDSCCQKEDWAENVRYEIFSYEKGMEIPKNQYTKWFDYDKMKNALCLRFREPGDYITLSGGGRKRVKAFMIDEKVPQDIRGKIPVLADGNHVVWIVGYRISEYYKITEDTKTILQVQFNGGKKDGR